MDDRTIAVVGGGPAGAYLAHLLGAAGARVDLYEPRGAWEKPCGGGVPPKVRQLIPEAASYGGPRNVVDTGVFISPRGIEMSFRSGRPLWIVPRLDFNKHFLNLARQHAGVAIHRLRVRAVRRDGDGWVLHCGKGERPRRADFLVAADGASSLVRRSVLGALGRRNLTTCFGFLTDPPDDPTRAVSQFLPGSGYIWAYPRPDRMCVGAGTWGSARSLDRVVRRFIDQRFPGIKIRSRWSALIPFVHEPELYDRPCSGERFAALGDAAGWVDAITGEGILYALWGARLLAQRLIEDRPLLFDDDWRDAFGRELRRVSQMGLRFYRPENIERAFSLAARSRTLGELVAQIMTDQPEYSRVPMMFARRLPLVALDLLRGRR
ncbi:MAG: NAD(P)/FAD-dependent oxidoreductase [Candidatus Alcyoniella australis]|nr:NAD(P)/FAD-dependent oxidoreductase [Candidatus Alcyoniella australis]